MNTEDTISELRVATERELEGLEAKLADLEHQRETYKKLIRRAKRFFADLEAAAVAQRCERSAELSPDKKLIQNIVSVFEASGRPSLKTDAIIRALAEGGLSYKKYTVASAIERMLNGQAPRLIRIARGEYALSRLDPVKLVQP